MSLVLEKKQDREGKLEKLLKHSDLKESAKLFAKYCVKIVCQKLKDFEKAKDQKDQKDQKGQKGETFLAIFYQNLPKDCFPLDREDINEVFSLLKPFFFNYKNVGLSWVDKTSVNSGLDITLYHLANGTCSKFSVSDPEETKFREACDTFYNNIKMEVEKDKKSEQDRGQIEKDSQGEKVEKDGKVEKDEKDGKDERKEKVEKDEKDGKKEKENPSKKKKEKVRKLIVYPEGMKMLEFKYLFAYHEVRKKLAEENIWLKLLVDDEFCVKYI